MLQKHPSVMRVLDDLWCSQFRNLMCSHSCWLQRSRSQLHLATSISCLWWNWKQLKCFSWGQNQGEKQHTVPVCPMCSACCKIRVVSLQPPRLAGLCWGQVAAFVSSWQDAKATWLSCAWRRGDLCRNAVLCANMVQAINSSVHFSSAFPDSKQKWLTKAIRVGWSNSAWLDATLQTSFVNEGEVGYGKGRIWRAFAPEWKKIFPLLSRPTVLAVPPCVHTQTLLSLFISKGTSKKQLVVLALHILSGLQMWVQFPVSLFCKSLDKSSPLKGLPFNQEEGKGIAFCLCSSFFCIFFFRITKVFYCPRSQQSLDVLH